MKNIYNSSVARYKRKKGGAKIISLVFMMMSALSAITSAASLNGSGSAITQSHQNSIIKNSNNSSDHSSPSKRSGGCLTLLSEIDKLPASNEINFVDVRLPEEYARYHIAGSINIPLHIVRMKEFLKTIPVILVNEGRCTSELENTCRELKQSGFKNISVLDGGLLGWHASQRPLDGDPIELSRLDHISAEELFEVRALANWTVIELSASGKNNDIRSWLPANVITLPLNSITSVSSTILQLRKKNPQEKVLLIADGDNTYRRIDVQLEKSGIASGVLYLDGGIKGYRAHVKNQLELWKQQNQQNQPRRYEACRG